VLLLLLVLILSIYAVDDELGRGWILFFSLEFKNDGTTLSLAVSIL